jgi:hypothetical protein
MLVPIVSAILALLGTVATRWFAIQEKKAEIALEVERLKAHKDKEESAS